MDVVVRQPRALTAMLTRYSVAFISCGPGVARGNRFCDVVVQRREGVDQDRVGQLFSFLEGLPNPFCPFPEDIIAKLQHSSGSWRKSMEIEILVGCQSHKRLSLSVGIQKTASRCSAYGLPCLLGYQGETN